MNVKHEWWVDDVILFRQFGTILAILREIVVSVMTHVHVFSVTLSSDVVVGAADV